MSGNSTVGFRFSLDTATKTYRPLMQASPLPNTKDYTIKCLLFRTAGPFTIHKKALFRGIHRLTVFIKRRDPGANTAIHEIQYPPTITWDKEEFTFRFSRLVTYGWYPPPKILSEKNN